MAPKPSQKEIEEVKEEIIRVKKEVESMGAKLWVESEGIDKGKTVYLEIPIEKEGDKTIKRRMLNDLIEGIETERKNWIKGACTLTKEDFKGKNFKEKILTLISVPLDWYTISRFFNLQKKIVKSVVKISNPNLTEEKFNADLERLKKDCQELRFLNKVFSDYHQLELPYYQKLTDFLNKKFLNFEDNQGLNPRLKKIKEVI